MKIAPFHTNRPEYPIEYRSVYHDDSDCGYAVEIKPEHRTAGTGDNPRCERCKDLDDPS